MEQVQPTPSHKKTAGLDKWLLGQPVRLASHTTLFTQVLLNDAVRVPMFARLDNQKVPPPTPRVTTGYSQPE